MDKGEHLQTSHAPEMLHDALSSSGQAAHPVDGFKASGNNGETLPNFCLQGKLIP
ncbi:hypothetical protein QO034_05505 [Sedimentitalea sp. JM2-8]|uniref:Uncharacterized protein n=1 Tax=Sedimentitalea xiamensis TaxID=3050037 RepID=A0ABT7FC87_9RHOB|nr:hypothetical protein [Sedimentitalea xiamensis]MDK3072560.1 hypothetical protein [Sedimentitalea xiamensis]